MRRRSSGSDQIESSVGLVEPDRFEGDAVKIHERRRKAFLELAKSDPERYRVIDTTGAAGPVAQEIWNVVAGKFALSVTTPVHNSSSNLRSQVFCSMIIGLRTTE